MLKVDYKMCYGEDGNDLYNIQIDHRREVKMDKWIWRGQIEGGKDTKEDL